VCQVEGTQSDFRPVRSSAEQIFILQQLFEKSWEYTKDVHTAYFIDLEKAHGRVPREKLW